MSLIKLVSIIASHAKETTTEDGMIEVGFRTDSFVKAVNLPAYLPLNGMTMSFDGDGNCVARCCLATRYR